MLLTDLIRTIIFLLSQLTRSLSVVDKRFEDFPIFTTAPL